MNIHSSAWEPPYLDFSFSFYTLKTNIFLDMILTYGVYSSHKRYLSNKKHLKIANISYLVQLNPVLNDDTRPTLSLHFNVNSDINKMDGFFKS